MSRFYEYYRNVVRPILICQYNIGNSKDVPKITFVRIGFSFSNLTDDEDSRLLKGFKFLMEVTGKRPGLGKVYWSSAGGRERRFVGSCYVTLRGKTAYNFLEYLILVVLPIHNKRYGYLDVGVSEAGVCNFVLRDLSVFYRQSEDVIGFDGKAQITVGTTGKGADETASLLRSLGLYVRVINENENR